MDGPSQGRDVPPVEAEPAIRQMLDYLDAGLCAEDGPHAEAEVAGWRADIKAKYEHYLRLANSHTTLGR